MNLSNSVVVVLGTFVFHIEVANDIDSNINNTIFLNIQASTLAK